jgi:hypothetical protein
MHIALEKIHCFPANRFMARQAFVFGNGKPREGESQQEKTEHDSGGSVHTIHPTIVRMIM